MVILDPQDPKEAVLVKLLSQALGETVLSGSRYNNFEDCDNLVKLLEEGLRIARDIRADKAGGSGQNP